MSSKHSLEVSLIYINRVGLAFVVYSLLVTKEFALRVEVYVASRVYNLGVGSTDVPLPLFWAEKKLLCDQTLITNTLAQPQRFEVAAKYNLFYVLRVFDKSLY